MTSHHALGIALQGFAGLPAADFVAAAREAEARGYHTAWTGEASGADAVTLSTLVLGATERLNMATGVLPIQTRTPVILGMTAATLNHAAPGRFILGLGLSSRVIIEQWHGLRFSPSLEQMREAVAIIRAVASGERVNFEGTYYRVKNFRMTAPPPSPPPRVVLAALGPEMLELAGEIADGVLMNWIPPEAIPRSLVHLEAGAKRGGRTLSDFLIGAFIRVCVTDDPEGARQHLARDIMGYVTVDVYASFFRAAGFVPEVDAASAAWKAGDRPGAVRAISPRFLDGLGVVGDEKFCRGRLAEFSRSGLAMPVVVPFTHERDVRASLLRTLRSFP